MNPLTGTPELRPGVFFECVGVPGVIDQMLVGAARGCRFVIVGVCMEPDQIRPLLGITNEINCSSCSVTRWRSSRRRCR